MSLAVELTADGGQLGLGVMLTTFGFGIRHGIDWDHIAAITDITTSQGSRRQSMWLATLYALGHALVVFLLGVTALVFADRVPASLDVVMGKIVGVTLVGLGAYVLYTLRRDGRDFRMRSRWTVAFGAAKRAQVWMRRRRGTEIEIEHEHLHPVDEPHPRESAHQLVSANRSHTEAPERHVHRHRHVLTEPDDPFATHGRTMSFGIGMIHGIGAETPTQVLLFVAAAGAAGRGTGILLLVCFLIGLVVSNTAVAVASTFGLNAATHFRAYATISVVIAAFSLCVGAALLAGVEPPAILPS